MKSAIRVTAPPAKPLVIYDGTCNFCRLWIGRWQQTTGETVDYQPYQEASLRERFPEVPLEDLERAVHIVETDGSVYSGAEAAFRALAENPHEQWLLEWYAHSPPFAFVSERVYRFIAAHRTFFSYATRLGWGRQVERPTYALVIAVFLRALGVIYLCAFISLSVQIIGLIGSNGILPVKETMQLAAQGMASAKIGLNRYHLIPTLCWFNTSDRFLQLQCGAGIFLSFLLLLGIAPAPCLFLLWVIYLSLTTAGREFLGFQWDNLLLEVGFLAIFCAPLQFLLRFRSGGHVSRLPLWLLRWLLFLILFESGCVKLLSGDPAWRKLTALAYHYETQPLPTWIGWYAHQLPFWFQKFSGVTMFAIELVLPFLIFTPRRLRGIACLGFALLQLGILVTGNYCFFNLLMFALCLVLLDDAALRRWFPARWGWANLGAEEGSPRVRSWPFQVTFPLTCIILAISFVQLSGMFHIRFPWPRPILSLYAWLAPFRTVNGYGLFAVMTTNRLEISVEGSVDGKAWQSYEFKYKPGDVLRRPGFVEPHQPRLDWQMWFAALGTYRENPWFLNFCARLLQGSPQTLALLAHNPFPNSPPRFLRAMIYEYHFTERATRRRTGAWWRRELKGQYLPVLSLHEEP